MSLQSCSHLTAAATLHLHVCAMNYLHVLQICVNQDFNIYIYNGKPKDTSNEQVRINWRNISWRVAWNSSGDDFASLIQCVWKIGVTLIG
jgi:hypothetical protein